ncbi:MAG: hypothetical protein K2X93_02460 [Candidatus Obscuribacterales bacterium]|nr:hypothetical protein [Candidatus Obscuribacterales bacterium]
MTDILFLGVGNVANAVVRRDGIYEIRYGTTRSANRLQELRSIGIEPVLIGSDFEVQSNSGAEELTTLSDASETVPTIQDISQNADVLVSFPPDGFSDEMLSRQIGNARKIVYISSTSVYGGTTGVVTEESSVDTSDPLSARRLEAEQIWRSKGAVILRAPSLYGPEYGLHLSLLKGVYKLPGDGSRYSSRIHLFDLAMIIGAVFAKAKPGSLYVVGDKNPATQLEVVEWLCNQLNIPMPDSVPIEEVHYTLRSNRQINAEKLTRELDIKLHFPTYKDGFLQCIQSRHSCEETRYLCWVDDSKIQAYFFEETD